MLKYTGTQFSLSTMVFLLISPRWREMRQGQFHVGHPSTYTRARDQNLPALTTIGYVASVLLPITLFRAMFSENVVYLNNFCGNSNSSVRLVIFQPRERDFQVENNLSPTSTQENKRLIIKQNYITNPLHFFEISFLSYCPQQTHLNPTLLGTCCRAMFNEIFLNIDKCSEVITYWKPFL